MKKLGVLLLVCLLTLLEMVPVQADRPVKSESEGTWDCPRIRLRPSLLPLLLNDRCDGMRHYDP